MTNIRFGYLIYNGVINSRLIRDLGSGDVNLIIPSFFGEDLSNQVKRGDIISIEQTNNTTGEITFLTRVITDINYDLNRITIESSFGVDFLAFTPITIYRSFTNENQELRNNQWSDRGVTYIKGTNITYVDSLTRSVDIGSVRNLSVGTVVTFSGFNDEFIITSIEEKNSVSGFPRFSFQSFQGSSLYASGVFGVGNVPDISNSVVNGYWVPDFEGPLEIGGSKIFLNFAPGSSGTFWSNFRGEDQIEIVCPGLLLEQESAAIITVANVDSIQRYGKIEISLDDNRFIQISLLEFMARTYLQDRSHPKLKFKITDLIQSIDKGGDTSIIPLI
ncbi:MAG: hypothetical protein ACC656_15825, partial [Candidatus Heimdallarchaeota archaeon]